MAKYFWDFSKYTANQQPSDWSEKWSTGSGTATVENSGLPPGFTGPHALRTEVTTQDTHYAISPDVLASVSGDVQILAKMLVAGTSTEDRRSRLIIHGGGTATLPHNYETQFLHNNSSSQGQFLIRRLSGSATVLMSPSFALDTNEVFWLRFDRSGNTIRYRFWRDNASEPGTWTASTSNSSLSSGFVGISPLRTSTSGSTILWVDQIGVGTNGDDAPSEPLQPDPPTGLTLNATGPTSISVTWNEPD